TSKTGSSEQSSNEDQQLVDSSHVTLDSGAEEGDDDGDTTSEDEASAEGSVRSPNVKQDAVIGVSSSGTVDGTSEVGLCVEQHSFAKEKGEIIRDFRNEGGQSSDKQLEVISGLQLDVKEVGAYKKGASKYSFTSCSPPLISPSKRTTKEPQMTLVMPNMPLALLSKGKNPSALDSSMSLFPLSSTSSVTDDQPLDLSTKPDKLASPSSRNKSSKGSDSLLTSPTSIHNGFSSLQSLQQRFGGDFPLEMKQKSSASVIPLQPSINHKSSLLSTAQPTHSESIVRPSSSAKVKPTVHPDWIERQEMMNSKAMTSSPLPKGENSRQASPSLSDESGIELGSKHTIHRCSCQKSFSTLYALSFHLQETGHTPGSSKAASLMDYPKLVRGQDMWLNQESEQTRRILRCMQCGESFKSLPLLTVHMMQTQHYTKIVSSDHGRRSHKCSTYCDRELDKECIFKCKVCHEAFTDMEGLANHMIVSGHHKKQSSRTNSLTNQSTFSESATNLNSAARQGRRKRFLPEDTNPSTVASLLEYRRKQSCDNGKINGFHSDLKSNSHLNVNNDSQSPDPRILKLVLCDSCGKRVDVLDFNSHIRACLKQREEVINALKNKLAAEEAILSRSESKLLRSGFSLASMSRFHNDSIFSRPGTESPPAPTDHRLFEEKIHSQELERKSEPSSPRDSEPTTDIKPITKQEETNAVEIPLKKWHSSNGDGCWPVSTDGASPSPGSKNCNTPVKLSFLSKQDRFKRDESEADLGAMSSLHSGKKRKLSEIEDNILDKARELAQRSSNLMLYDKSVDFTSSALHQLDMFSRGLKFSPPRQNLSPDHKTNHQKLNKRKEMSSQSLSSKKELPKSPAPVASPALSTHHKSASPDQAKKEVTFDIIDPNTLEDQGEAKSSALEAMETFIQKSFSSKSDMRTSNLATMFSPFRNCFPLPAQGGVLPALSDPTMSQFAKFSKFFRMVPGMPSFTDIGSASDATNRNVMTESRTSSNQEKAASLGKKTANKPYSVNSATKNSSGVKIPMDNLLGNVNQDTYSSSKKGIEVQSSKKYKYSSISSLDLSQINTKLNSFLTSTASYSASPTNALNDQPSSKVSQEWDSPNEDLRKKRKKEVQMDGASDSNKTYIKCENTSESGQLEGVNIKVERMSDDEEETRKPERSDMQLDPSFLYKPSPQEVSDKSSSPPVSEPREIQSNKPALKVHVEQEMTSSCLGNNKPTMKMPNVVNASKETDIPSAEHSPAIEPEDGKLKVDSTRLRNADEELDSESSSSNLNFTGDICKIDNRAEKQLCESNTHGDETLTKDVAKPKRGLEPTDHILDSRAACKKKKAVTGEIQIKTEVDTCADTNESDGDEASESSPKLCVDTCAIKVENNDRSDSDYDKECDTAVAQARLNEMSRPSSCESSRAQPSPSLHESSRDVSPASSGHSESRKKSTKSSNKKSALDSLSSFVYSQPLTSEHPLDSLQRLLSTNDLIHAAQEKHIATSSHKSLTPDLTTPLNLTARISTNGVGSGGCSSDDNDEADAALAEGGASEGEISEYKCAACNRRFASKGSYRYHLSRCHLSSVKKYGIKEAFNMSPYVYLPLDHTAKFSKYYQLARELANKGK
ncbi:hypothetical protein BgiMline_018903, partial [Biomphalaria glabrata]